jgi:4-hydroxybenzoate polyprenyltransferase
MRHSPWSIAVIGLAVGSLAIVGGSTIGGHLGPLTAGYGLLIALAALYAIAMLLVRDRARRRRSRRDGAPSVETLAGTRIF